MVALTLKQLLKRNNINIFIEKILNEEEFKAIKSKEHLFQEKIILKKDYDLINELKNLIETESVLSLSERYYAKNQLLVETIDGTKIPSGFLHKSIEFGSISSQKIYQKESETFSSLKEAFKSATNNYQNLITLKIVDSTGKEIATINNALDIIQTSKIKGNYTKSDFELVDKNNNSIFWISHKSGTRSSSFRQWSGIKDFVEHEELKAFEKDLKNNYRNHIKHHNIGRLIKDPKLKLNAVFGNQNEDYGPNRVNVVIQGNISLIKDSEQKYMLKTNSYIFDSKNNLTDMPKDYDPIIFGTKLNLEPNRCSFGIQGCRGLIYPLKGKKVKLI